MTRKDRLENIGLNLEFLSEPALIVNLEGEVRGANSAARGLLGFGDKAASLLDIVQDSGDDAVAYLRRASGSTSSHVGSITLARGETAERFRALAARIPCSKGTEPLLILRLMPPQDDQFSVLNRRLREMDRQLHQRLKENAMLQEALAENRVLVSELQHRVKNNIQQMLSLIKMSARNRQTPDVADMVTTATHRLRAMATTQEALYQVAGAGSIAARAFLEDVVRGAASGSGASEMLEVSIADEQMTSEEAHCLALIANELITNACKHGLANAVGRVSVRLSSAAEDLLFEVCDDGPGIDEGASSRSSGLTLVRAICRQIGAKLEITNDRGTKCAVQFRSDLATRDGHETPRADR
jgi:two-component sensor histidine kinase